MTATQDTPVNAPTTIDAGLLTLSARIRRPRQQPRGVIVALHGGTYDSSYYDTGADSLLDLAATLGYLVVAVDRPGYGATHGADPELLTFDAQTTILSQALLRVWTDIGQRADLVLIGHSIGGMLALCAAATRPAVPLRGVEVSGMGELWQPGLREMWGSLIGDAAEVTVPANAHNQVMYGPEGTFERGPASQVHRAATTDPHAGADRCRGLVRPPAPGRRRHRRASPRYPRRTRQHLAVRRGGTDRPAPALHPVPLDPG